MRNFCFLLCVFIIFVFFIIYSDAICDEENIEALKNCYKLQLFDKYNLPENAEKFAEQINFVWSEKPQKLCKIMKTFNICLEKEIIENCINVESYSKLSFINRFSDAAEQFVEIYNLNTNRCNGYYLPTTTVAATTLPSSTTTTFISSTEADLNNPVTFAAILEPLSFSNRIQPNMSLFTFFTFFIFYFLM